MYVSVQVRVREQTCTNMYKHNYRVPADTYTISKAQHYAQSAESPIVLYKYNLYIIYL